MKHAVKRLLAVVLTFVMLVAIVPLGFSGDFVFPVLSAADITDTYVKPIEGSTETVRISTANDWLSFSNDSVSNSALFKGKTVVLEHDIDLSSLSAVGSFA